MKVESGQIILPFIIFLAMAVEVFMGVTRLILNSKGSKYISSIIGFFELLLWLFIIEQIVRNLSNFACYFAYAGGYSMGNFIGVWVVHKILSERKEK